MYFVPYLQIFCKRVDQAKVASSWLMANSYLFQQAITSPSLVTEDDNTVAQILSRLLDENENYEQYRDDLLFNCESDRDLTLFTSLMSALELKLNYCLSGHE